MTSSNSGSSYGFHERDSSNRSQEVRFGRLLDRLSLVDDQESDTSQVRSQVHSLLWGSASGEDTASPRVRGRRRCTPHPKVYSPPYPLTPTPESQSTSPNDYDEFHHSSRPDTRAYQTHTPSSASPILASSIHDRRPRFQSEEDTLCRTYAPVSSPIDPLSDTYSHPHMIESLSLRRSDINVTAPPTAIFHRHASPGLETEWHAPHPERPLRAEVIKIESVAEGWSDLSGESEGGRYSWKDYKQMGSNVEKSISGRGKKRSSRPEVQWFLDFHPVAPNVIALVAEYGICSTIVSLTKRESCFR
nr:uncharacterized protein CI109_005687 [Kwoniella shandongensis]KAA5525940.1 hypothetical protein CI109_005687 [Kwoniella shandongensis]